MCKIYKQHCGEGRLPWKHTKQQSVANADAQSFSAGPIKIKRQMALPLSGRRGVGVRLRRGVGVRLCDEAL